MRGPLTQNKSTNGQRPSRKTRGEEKEMNAVSKKTTGRVGLKSDKLFYCLILVFPVLQFVVFYIGVNLNSFLLAFKDISLDESMHYHTSWSVNAFKDAFDLVQTSEILQVIKVSFLTYFLKTIISLPLGLLFSYYIAKKLSGAGFFRVILFLPSILSAIVMVSLFKYFVNDAIPAVVGKLTGETEVLSLLSRSNGVQYATILFYNLWIGFGVSVLMYANAMSGISPSVLDAAKIDGATGLKEFWHVTLPSVFSTVSVFLITGVAAIFTDQFNLYSFYGSDPSVPFKTFGYYLFFQTNKYVNDMSHYPVLSAFGLMMTIVAVPLTFLVKHLLEKFGPRED